MTSVGAQELGLGKASAGEEQRRGPPSLFFQGKNNETANTGIHWLLMP